MHLISFAIDWSTFVFCFANHFFVAFIVAAMPFYQRGWNVALGEQAPKPPPNNKKLRKIPPGEQPPQEKPSPQKQTSIDANKVIFIQQMLKTQVEELMAAKCATTIKGDENFLNYVIQKDRLCFEGKYSTIFQCFNHQFVDHSMICRIYQPNSMIIPENDMFLKVLRYLGKSCYFSISHFQWSN